MPQVNASPDVALRILTDSWPKALKGDGRGLHAVRVASRRLREALRLIDHPRRESRKLARELKRITRIAAVQSDRSPAVGAQHVDMT